MKTHLIARTALTVVFSSLSVAASFASTIPAPEIAVPAMDHHQHLFSPGLAAIVNGQASPFISLPADISAVIAARAAAWNRPFELSLLLTDGAEVLTRERRGWLTGRQAAAQFLGTMVGRAVTLTPVQFRSRGDIADISGYYSRGEISAPVHVGYFQMTVEKGADHRWRISREVPIFPFPAEQKPITSDDLVRMLDEAGIARAAVLSEAFWYDGPNIKVTDPYPKVMAENDWTAQEVARHSGRLIAFCSFNPVADHALVELKRCAESGAFAGVKMSFAMSGVDMMKADHLRRVQRVFAAANERRLPIVVHLSSGSTYGPEHATVFVERVLPLAPDIPIQIAHLWGGEGFSKPALDALISAVRARPPGTRQLYFDLAEVWTAKSSENLAAVAAAVRAIGVTRILYGSDAALNGRLQPAEAWRMLRASVPLTDVEFRQIAQNAAPYWSQPSKSSPSR